MTFSICIPNYNYEKYLGVTLKSVLEQKAELEVLISDNASTDGSLSLIKGFADGRIKVHVNDANVGFAANLDRAARMAKGQLMLMLSSDDVMQPEALSTYEKLFTAVEPDAVVTASAEIIDSAGVKTGRLGPIEGLWNVGDIDAALTRKLGADVYRVEAGELLRRCLLRVANPFNFLATAYPRELYRRIEGYGAGRVMGPDKWFHWRLLGAASYAYFIDAPLFSYRVHATNQLAQEAQSGALKFMVDEYVNSFEVPPALLTRAQLTKAEVEQAFVEYDIARHGLATLARGGATKARRIVLFGLSTYPQHAAKNWKVWTLAALLATGPVGQRCARIAWERLQKSRGHEA